MTRIKLIESEIEILREYFPEGLICLDFETTGLSPVSHDIIEMAAVKVDENGNVSEFSSLVNPEKEISKESIKIHNITDDMVKDSPKMKDILPQFAEFLGDYPLVAHNAKFDVGFLVSALYKNQVPIGKNEVFCSCKMARQLFKNVPNNRLKTLSKHFNITLDNEHRALDDTWAALKVVVEGARALKERQKSLNQRNSFKLLNLKDFRQDSFKSVPEHLKELDDVIPSQEVIEIKYSGGTHRGVFRPVKPVAIIPLPDGPVLHALCLLSSIYKPFRLSKIRSMKRLSLEEQKKWQS